MHIHDHIHDHRHGHPRSPEQRYSSRRHPEQVVLDIGEDIGALIVHTDASMIGIEVEISAAGHDEIRTHKEVLEREINGRPAPTLVYDGLPAGSYTLWLDGLARQRDVIVHGGAVSELSWAERLAA
jgi:hypothetical protein